MRANLATREPEMLLKWQDLYAKLRQQSKGRKKFVLHLGPPYANGSIHMGHALTQILKDIINKLQQMRGFDAEMIFGFDCHGLPIEWKIEQDIRAKGKHKSDITIPEFRAKCAAFAQGWVEKQSKEYTRLGICADLDEPYLTMRHSSQASILSTFYDLVLKGYVKPGQKPILYSFAEQTALAEAEVEYKEKESRAVDVTFAISDSEMLVIWTTTPWTLPQNQAIAYNPKIVYVKISHPLAEGKYVILARDLVPEFYKRVGLNPEKVEAVLNNVVDLITIQHVKHPFYDRSVPVVAASFVENTSGTGLVHIAPCYGIDDFNLGKEHNLDTTDILTDEGIYQSNVELFAGQFALDANGSVIEVLKLRGNLLSEHVLKHSYPHSWRSKTPLVYRACKQWFIDLSEIKHEVLAKLDQVKFYPAAGANRLRAMVEGRDAWCISRQRCWGVPLGLFIHKETGEMLVDKELFAKVVAKVEEEGSDWWFNQKNAAAAFLPQKYSSEYTPIYDILDVWFDSGCSWRYVVDKRLNTQQADVYLEGSDQHRGWFLSSLLLSIATRGIAPYKTVITHGFILGSDGAKLSKSLGNYVALEDVLEYGADIIRLWVINADSTQDVKIGPKILETTAEMYRKIRNTIRFMLGALQDKIVVEEVSYEQLGWLDKWILYKLRLLEQKMHESGIDIDKIRAFYQELYQFCNEDLSSIYFDSKKDTLYCDAVDNLGRKATLTVISITLHRLLLLLAPVLSFTADEAFSILFEGKCVHLELFKMEGSLLEVAKQDFIEEKQVFEIKAAFNAKIEALRQDKRINSKLETKVMLPIRLQSYAGLDWQELLGSSEVSFQDIEEMQITIHAGSKCLRCWRYYENIGTHCKRCSSTEI